MYKNLLYINIYLKCINIFCLEHLLIIEKCLLVLSNKCSFE